MKILIVDDDALSRDILTKFVALAGDHQITVVTGGEEAWTLLDDPSRYFDVVFLDLVMPKPDGFEVLQRIRNQPTLASVEVILCTGSNDRATIAKAIKLGARHYIVKPCTDAVIAAKLNQIRPHDAAAKAHLTRST